MNKSHAPSPVSARSISVVGGGRWARILVSTTCNLVSAETEVSIYSKSNAPGMRAWAKQQNFLQRVSVYVGYDDSVKPAPRAAIIANAARDHMQATAWALAAGLPTLVEKPFALSASATSQMLAQARDSNVYLASAHVFLFSSYLQRFSQAVAATGPINTIEISWRDPVAEERYGDQKNYDSSIPVFADCLPHIVSIILMLIGPCDITFRKIVTKRGGAYVELELIGGGVRIKVILERNAECRQRLINVEATPGSMALDFTVEPGVMTLDGEKQNADPDWLHRPRPLAQMVQSFIQGAMGGQRDPRLDTGIALNASKVIDAIYHDYVDAKDRWIGSRLSRDVSSCDEELKYALVESLQVDGPLPLQQMEKAIAEIIKGCSGNDIESAEGNATISTLVSRLFGPNAL